MVPFSKIVAVLLAVATFQNPFKGMDSHAIRKSLSNTLDFFFCLAFVSVVLIQLGLVKVSPLESRGYDALSELILGLGKALFFILLPTILLCWMLRGIEGLAVRVAIYGAFAVIGVAGYHFAMERAKADAKGGETTARANVEVREVQAHADYAARLAELSAEAHVRWRADVEAAGAWGGDGVVPPMLVVTNPGSSSLKVTNQASRTICVGIARVLRKPGTDVYDRCPQDIGRRCSEILPGRSAQVGMFPDTASPACGGGFYEYRIGTPMQPKPSWWSRSALDDFDRHPPDPMAGLTNLPTMRLRGEIAILEDMLAEKDRAKRWREASHR